MGKVVKRREEGTKRGKGSRKGERREREKREERGRKEKGGEERTRKKGRFFAFCSHCHYLKL